MKVKDLIEQLQKQDPEVEVVTEYRDMELGYILSTCLSIDNIKMARVAKRAHDAFDGGSYVQEVLTTCNEDNVNGVDAIMIR